MTAIAKRTESFTETDLDDEIVIMRLDDGELLSLSGSAAAIWRLIDGTRDLAALRAELAAEFDTGEEEEVAGDVAAFVLRLREKGLLGEG